MQLLRGLKKEKSGPRFLLNLVGMKFHTQEQLQTEAFIVCHHYRLPCSDFPKNRKIENPERVPLASDHRARTWASNQGLLVTLENGEWVGLGCLMHVC